MRTRRPLSASDLSTPALEIGAPHTAARLDFLDGIRGAAALYVVCHHIAKHLPLEHASRAVRLLALLLNFGHYAVSVFIVLSGFCLMLPIVRGDGRLRGGVGRFFQRRAKRILPPYYLAMALSLALIATLIGTKTGTWWDGSVPVTPHAVITHLLLVQDYFDSTRINHVFWSVATEWHIYFLFPLLLLLFRRLGSGRATAVGVSVAYLCSVLTIRQNLHIEMLGQFILGMFGATLAYSREPRVLAWRDRAPWGTIVVLAAALTAVLGALGHRLYGITIYLEPLVGIGTVALILHALRSGPNSVRSALSWRPALALGGFSYSLYLIHAPLIQLFWQYGIAPLHRGTATSFLLLLAVGTPLIVAAAWLFSLVGERPFLNRPTQKPVEASDENLVRSPGHPHLP
jgi:peptidoglycan/LPS O-acetylase OafA/YrhL